MASAQLLNNIDTKPTTKTTTTAKSNSNFNTTKTKTTSQSSIDHHYREKLSIFCNKTEVERKEEQEKPNNITGNIKCKSNITNRKQYTNIFKSTNNYQNSSPSTKTNEREETIKENNSFTPDKTKNPQNDDIKTKIVFNSYQQLQNQQQESKQREQLWPGTKQEKEKCCYSKSMQATEQQKAASATKATQLFRTDDVVGHANAGVQWQQIARVCNIDNKLYETKSKEKCRQLASTSDIIIANRNKQNRTIQQQQPNNYAYDADDDDVSILDYKGIEEFKIHTNKNQNKSFSNYHNNYNKNKNHNTKMLNNKNIILEKCLPVSGSNENNNVFQKPKNGSTKCCQSYVAKHCCRNCNKNKNNKYKKHKTNTTKPSKQQHPQPQQTQIQQQRNFYFKSRFSNTTTTKTTATFTQTPQQQTLFFTTSTTNTFINISKFYWDLQKMSKYLLSLLVIFHMLPLFYAECDQTFVSRIGGPQNGTFSAPLLHNLKNHSRQCLYTFLAGPGQRVEVIFKTFNLRGTPPDGSAVGELPSCVHEYMDIYSEVQSSEPAELINSPFGGRYCGTIPPRQRISMYRAIAISFFTNKNITTPDLFEGTFRFINASEYEIGIPIAGSPCSYTITPSLSINKTGVLISPTYPGAYPKDMSCTYQFLGESNQRVRLEFRDFDLFFGGPHCPFDYVKVYDGPDNSSALIGTYCGQQRNLVLYSSESSLFVHFFTLSRTANSQNRGFKGIYEFSESFVKLDFIRENDGIHIRGSECDQKILSRKESTGFVLSPNYPYPYIPKTVCRYFIYGMQDAQHLERVRLEFTAFNIPRVESKDKDKETNCSDGYLKIYLKGQETADAYDKFDYELCGNETQRVVSDGPRLAMVFSSGELQGRGFKGKYVFETEYKIPGTAAPDGSCSFTYVSSSKKRGELNSPRYPSNYPSDTNCSYLFLAEPNEQVTIVFDHFKIKADGNSNVTAGAYGSVICFEDWLEMYVVYRDNNDRFLGRYCGMTAPGPVESPRGAVGLRITLHTDQENVASGFKARYFFETAKSEIGDCGGNFSNEDSGIITSPNYPAGYKAPGRGMASMACNWLMTARTGYKLSIHFEQFSLEGDPTNRGCPAAVLRLWVNVDSDQPPLELCGEKPPIEQWHYISTGQTARISFTTSDKTVGAPGFRIVWTEIQDSGPVPPTFGLQCDSTYHFQCVAGYCISDKLRCDGVKNCGPSDDSDELHCTTKAQAEDHGVLIIITLLGVSFLICLLCILYHSRRKRRQQLHQMGLHRNAHYDSQTSATVFRRF